jgi:hypothetical protein
VTAHDEAVEALRRACRELLDAEEAYRFAPTLENTSRLARARRAAESAASLVDSDRPAS